VTTIYAWIGGEWRTITEKTYSECYAKADQLGAVKVREQGWTVVKISGEWVYLGKEVQP